MTNDQPIDDPTEYKSKLAEAALTESTLDPETYLIKAFLAGRSGTGKTESATTLPGRKLLIDVDNRAQSVAGKNEVEVLPCVELDHKSPKAWKHLESIRKQIVLEISKGVLPYDSIIFDGLTMMGRISMNWALLLDPKRGLGGSPAQQHYGPQMNDLSKFVISTIALPVNICYTGHMEFIEDKTTGKTDLYPKITGKLRTEVENWFSETYLCYRTEDDEGEKTYRWLTGGSGRYEFFKSSLNHLGNYWGDPIDINFKDTGKPVGFMDLLSRRFDKKGES